MSKIEWTEHTWNPVIGCSKVSQGCENCYAEKMAFRLSEMERSKMIKEGKKPSSMPYNHVIGSKKWIGRTHFVENALDKPLNRKKPTMYFVCSMGDLFHESVPFEWISKVMVEIAFNKQHIYQILTKRPERMKHFFETKGIPILNMPNVWLGVTAENQEQANKRIPILLEIPAAIRFVSVEPMLSAVDLTHEWGAYQDGNDSPLRKKWIDGIDWVICGGESGHKARPLHPDWARSLRDQCEGAETPFFFKQWGEWEEGIKGLVKMTPKKHAFVYNDGSIADWNGVLENGRRATLMSKVGKKKAGSLLDGKEYKQFPKT